MNCVICKRKATTSFAKALLCNNHKQMLQEEFEKWYNFEIDDEERHVWKMIKPYTYHHKGD